MGKLVAYIRLMRPANVVTSLADVLLGFAVAGIAVDFSTYGNFEVSVNYSMVVIFLLLSSAFLYAGGVVLNDYFDADLDRVERPERPIPSGKVTELSALVLGTSLTIAGVLSAFVVSILSGCIAAAIAVLSVLYNKYSKHKPWGALNMGACRAANLLLGMSIIAGAIVEYWFLIFIPLIYIGAITILSTGEVNPQPKKTVENGLLLYILMIIGIVHLALLDKFQFWNCFPFLMLFIILTLPVIVSAVRDPEPMSVRKAVKRSILSLIILDASLASGFAGWEYGIMVVVLLPFSLLLAKRFSVT